MALNNLIAGAIGVMILAIVNFVVVLPILKDTITSANLTGTELTIANLIPLFVVLGVFMIVVAVFVIRWL